jgi:hypothetical protein
MRRTLVIASTIWTAIFTLACTRANLARPSGSADTAEVIADASEGRKVLAVLKAIEPKSYTDDLPGGEVLVSDVMRFSIVEPMELAGATVMAYYRGAPDIDGRPLKLGEFVYFKLPSGPLRHGILLGDLKDLRFK